MSHHDLPGAGSKNENNYQKKTVRGPRVVGYGVVTTT